MIFDLSNHTISEIIKTIISEEKLFISKYLEFCPNSNNSNFEKFIFWFKNQEFNIYLNPITKTRLHFFDNKNSFFLEHLESQKSNTLKFPSSGSTYFGLKADSEIILNFLTHILGVSENHISDSDKKLIEELI